MMETLEDRVKRHEGIRLFPYKCTAGKTSIGYGRNLDDKGISQQEADFLFKNDLAKCEREYFQLPRAVRGRCSEVRKGVLIEMIYQLGYNGVTRFRQMLQAIQDDDFERAADEMLDSRWFQQTSSRCKELSEIFRNG